MKLKCRSRSCIISRELPTFERKWLTLLDYPLPVIKCLCGARLVADISTNGLYIEVRPCEKCIHDAEMKAVDRNS